LSSSSTDATLVDVVMPQMGVSVAEGTVAEWAKQPGDWVDADETICVISTDKIDTDLPAPASGRLTEIEIAAGETVPVGTVLARIDTGGKPGQAHAAEDLGPPEPGTEAAAAAKASVEPDAARAGDQASGVRRQASGDRRQASGNGQGAKRFSPVVMRMAAEHGIDLSAIEGTGRGGRVTKKDVVAFLERGEQAPLHIESPYRAEPEPPDARRLTPDASSDPAHPPATLSRMRRSIGEHMKRSLETAATCTTWTEADMSRIEAARERLRLTALPLVARCAIAALREHPQLNAWLEGERYTRHDAVHLGIAVSLDDEGLIVPVIHDAHELSAEGLARRIKDVARRGRAHPRRGSRRDVHDHQPGPVRLDHGHAGDQPAAGRDPRPRGDRQAPRGDRRRDRDPADDHLRPELGPPRARRRARGTVPGVASAARRELGRDVGTDRGMYGGIVAVMAAELWTCNLGRVEYREASALQKRLRAARQADEIPDLLLLLDHPPVYTLGRRSGEGDLPMGEAWYLGQGIDVVRTNRGGKLTYHGPGQLVGYAIMRTGDVLAFVRTMERAVIAALADEGLPAHARTDEGPDFTGVWVGERKIASIGVHVARGVTTHGFAVNVSNDLQPFEWVVPCGLPEVRMTSVTAEAREPRTLDCFRRRAGYRFAEAHGRRQRLVSPARLERRVPSMA
jgi:lipoate-protein ligase B